MDMVVSSIDPSPPIGVGVLKGLRQALKIITKFKFDRDGEPKNLKFMRNHIVLFFQILFKYIGFLLL